MKIISVDPGLSGAFCIKDGESVLVHDMPILKSKTKKDTFDISAIVSLLEPHKDADVFFIEDIHCMPKNGAVSMFNFGRGKGILEGIGFALGLNVQYVTPQTWKKSYAELAPPAKVKLPKGTKKPKVPAPKTKKEKAEVAKEKRLVKALAKENARKLAGTLYPKLLDRFKTVNSDGRAEAVLIAHYAEKHYKETTV